MRVRWLKTRCVVLALVSSVLPGKGQSIRPITVADTITMTEVASQGPGLHDFMLLSPDSEHFSVVIEQGKIRSNERIFTLLVFRTKGVFDEPAVRIAVERTSSNADAISDVRWLNDSTLTFLGAAENGTVEVYAANIETKTVRQLTRHPTNINAYGVAPSLDRVIYTADADLTSANTVLRMQGFTVTDQSFIDLAMGNLVNGRLRWRNLDYELPQQTFVMDLSSGSVAQIADSDEIVVVPNSLFPFSRNPVSPDGRYAVLQGLARACSKWDFFRSPFPSTIDGSRDMTTFVLVDMRSGISSQLIDAPSSPYLTSILWSPDSRSAVLVNTFSPGDTKTSEKEKSIDTTIVAQVDIATRRVTRIQGRALSASVAQGVVCAQALGWRSKESLVLALSKSPDSQGGVCDFDEVGIYKKEGPVWRELGTDSVDSVLRSSSDGRITISLDQGLNTAPNLKAIDHSTGRTKLFTDFNPQLRSLQLAHVSLITWTASDGDQWSGDLYVPPADTSGKPYPLVIQTHGCTTDKFEITGFEPGGATGYAAQVLANKGIVVLQEGHCGKLQRKSPSSRPYYSGTNAEHEVLGFESAIDLLAKQGLIDRKRVGLQGHSATSWIVIYAVAHPKIRYRYSAVLSTARGDMGYFAYLATLYGRLWSVQGNGGLPMGKNSERFWRDSLATNLEQINTPIMSQEPDGLRYLPFMWEIHETLRMLGKPEAFLVFPDGTHNLVKPFERLKSGQAAVDWFCFWLKGEEDRDPAKAEQYSRWRSMNHTK